MLIPTQKMMCIHLYRKRRQNASKQTTVFICLFFYSPLLAQCQPNLPPAELAKLYQPLSLVDKAINNAGYQKKKNVSAESFANLIMKPPVFIPCAGCCCDWQVVGLVPLPDGAGRPARRQAAAPLQVQRLLWPESKSETPDTFVQLTVRTAHQGTLFQWLNVALCFCIVLVRRG